MSKILDDVSVSKNLIAGLENFYTMFDIHHILHRVGADKEHGIVNGGNLMRQWLNRRCVNCSHRIEEPRQLYAPCLRNQTNFVCSNTFNISPASFLDKPRVR